MGSSGKRRVHGECELSHPTMHNFLILSVLGLALLQPLVEGFFLGPIAVGAAIGALAIGKGLFLGALLSSRRSRRQHYRHSRSYRYKPSHHYSTRYNRYYTRQPSYYYSSGYSHHRYGKREAMEVSQEELSRFKREIEEQFNSGAWFLEMIEKDQDDCTKRLICEMAAKKESGYLTGVEAELSEAFGLGNSIDVSSSKAVFDLAAQSGKLMGKARCEQFYRRCDTPVQDMIAMINTELKEFEKLEEELMKTSDPIARAESEMDKETEEITKELQTDSEWNYAL